MRYKYKDKMEDYRTPEKVAMRNDWYQTMQNTLDVNIPC